MITVASTAPSVARDLAALTKARLSSLVLLTTAGGMWLAPGAVDPVRACVTLLATALVVAGAQALNSYLERDIDARMERTRHRPLPSGRMEPRTALAIGLALPAVGLPALFVAVNPLAGLLGAVALASYVLVYTPLKPVTPLALFVGAVPGAIPPLLGWAAVTGRADAPGLVLFAILFVWQLPHFLALALWLKDDFARGGLRVLPVAAPERWSRALVALFAVALVPVTLLLVPLGVTGRGYGWAAGVLGAAFAGVSLAGLRPGARPAAAWARRVFLGSLAYLTLLFAALILDVR